MSGTETFSYTGTVQTFTVTTTGTYDITAFGAQGGGGFATNPTDIAASAGGDGAEIGGDVFLTAGETIEIIVGGAGTTNTSGFPGGGGGGGGTFVIETFNGSSAVHDKLMIAGGGGGGYFQALGYGGVTTTTGGAGGGGGGNGGAGGHGGYGGSPGAGGGGGYIGGNGAASGGTSSNGSGSNGSSYAGAGAGSGNGHGGFGGGGGGGYAGGGGGGGYGGGGGAAGYAGGGGGGSFDGGTNQTLVAGENTGNGSVTITLVCFLENTRIATPGGERAVEALRIGDFVSTADGHAAPVKWIGRRTLHADGFGGYRHADPLTVMPIRIRAGALGEGLPVRDLLVSPGHALFVGGLLIQAGALLNGLSIVREGRMPQTFTYYHVELANHALILAENVPAETFLDGVEPLAFNNWQERAALFPERAPVEELPYPRVKASRQVPPHIRQRLTERARKLFAGAEAIAA